MPAAHVALGQRHLLDTGLREALPVAPAAPLYGVAAAGLLPRPVYWPPSNDPAVPGELGTVASGGTALPHASWWVAVPHDLEGGGRCQGRADSWRSPSHDGAGLPG